MSEFYEFEGATYEVGSSKLEEFMQKFPDATKAQQSFEIESLPGFEQAPLQPGDGILTEDQISQQKKDARTERAARDVLKNFYSSTTGIPNLHYHT